MYQGKVSKIGKTLPSGNKSLQFEVLGVYCYRSVIHAVDLLIMKYAPHDIGEIVHTARKNLGVTQKALALTSGTGLRFIIDLEKGKSTCQIGKALTVLNTLGVRLDVTPPSSIKPAARGAQGVKLIGGVVR